MTDIHVAHREVSHMLVLEAETASPMSPDLKLSQLLLVMLENYLFRAISKYFIMK